MDNIEKKEIASETGHWYDPITGDPRYTYTNKKGEIKNTTLREARKYGWVPSVSGIIQCAAKPALTSWMIDQGILCALTLTRTDTETDTEYLARVKEDSKQRAIKAAQRGTQIHAWVEEGFNGHVTKEAQPYFDAAVRALSEHGIEAFNYDDPFQTEKSFACIRYGGKVDLHCQQYVIDVKTKDKAITFDTWPDQHMQLAAYRAGLGVHGAKCGILYISEYEKAFEMVIESRLVWVKESDLTKGLKMFNALVDFWYVSKELQARSIE
jgi:hypothetical protein